MVRSRFHSADVRDGRMVNGHTDGRGFAPRTQLPDGRRSLAVGVFRGSHPRQSTDAEMILFAGSRQGRNHLGVMW